MLIGVQSQDIGIELPGAFYFLRGRTNPDTVVVQFDNFNRHSESSLRVSLALLHIHPIAQDSRAGEETAKVVACPDPW